MDELIEKSKIPIFFIHPEENYDNEDLDTMIDYFITTEEYEKCTILNKLKNKMNESRDLKRIQEFVDKLQPPTQLMIRLILLKSIRMTT